MLKHKQCYVGIKHLDSAVVRALTSHQRGPGSNPYIDAIILC